MKIIEMSIEEIIDNGKVRDLKIEAVSYKDNKGGWGEGLIY